MSDQDERVSPLWRASIAVLRALPQRALSRLWGRVAGIRWPRPIQARLNRGFARLFGVNIREAEAPPEHYPSLSAFFVRGLREGVRPWPDDPFVPGSPADGILGASGPIRDGALLQAKGVSYSVAEFLGDAREASHYPSGVFFTIYLSPRHYHRVHAPISAGLTTARAIPGRLLPVNRAAVRLVPDLFRSNERLVAVMEHDGCRVAVVAVGAYNVGGISADFDPDWRPDPPGVVTNRPGRPAVDVRTHAPPIRLLRGDPLMTFHLGSTVVLLVHREGGLPMVAPNLATGNEIRLGAPLFTDGLGR